MVGKRQVAVSNKVVRVGKGQEKLKATWTSGGPRGERPGGRSSHAEAVRLQCA